MNDRFGHAVGDEVLKFVGNKLVEKAGDTQIARYGGDEFAIVASIQDSGLANELAVELCSYFSNHRLVLQQNGDKLNKLTISIGAAMIRGDDDTNSWIERTDNLQYAAKNGGRNRSMVERKII